VPVSSPVAAVAKKAAPAPAPAPAPTPPRARPVAEALPAFAEEEIDNLVGDVAEIEVPPVAVPVPRVPVPVAAPVSAAPEEDGAIWLGSPDGEDAETFTAAGSTFGPNVSLEDLLSAETDPGAPPRAPEPEPSAWAPTARFGSEFEVDRGFDPEWATPVPADPEPPAPPARVEAARPVAPRAPEPPAPEPLPVRAPVAQELEEEVLLTEVASDDELFEDPSLEVARLGGGEQREILVPVQIGEGATARRFKLSIRLRLDPID